MEDEHEEPESRAERHLHARVTGGPVPTGDRWHYHRAIPVARFATGRATPDAPGLPPAADDPYAGVGGTAPVTVWFHDVFGNASAGGEGGTVDCGADPGPGHLCVPVRYMDEVIGVGSWPGVTLDYAVEPGDAPPAARVTVQAALQPGAYVPAAGAGAATAREAAAAHQRRWQAVHHQLAQADVRADLRTTLETADGIAVPLPVELAALRAFAAGAWVALGTFARVESVHPDASAGGTLGEAAAAYGVTWAALASANPRVPVRQILRDPSITVPRYGIFPEGGTVADVAASPPPGMSPLEPGVMLARNTAVELRPGAAVSTPARTLALGADPPTLARAAADHAATLGGLAAGNAAARGLLRAGAVLRYHELSVTVAETGTPAASESFDEFAKRLVALGADPLTTGADVAAANADAAGIFAPGATLTAFDYVARDEDTLAANASGFAADVLAPLNTRTAGLFVGGTPLLFGDETVQAGERTLGELAEEMGTPAERILFANGAAALAAEPALEIPGAVRLPPDVAVPYVVRPGETLDGIAARFDFTGDRPLALARRNLRTPGLLSPGRTVTVEGATATTEAGDDLQALLDRLSAAVGHPVELALLVSAVDRQAGILRPGALLVCSAAIAPSGGGPVSLRFLAAAYGVAVDALAAANAALLAFPAPGVALTVLVDGRPATVTTGARDTLNAAVARFGASSVTLEQVARANADVPLVAAGVRFILPPPAAKLAAAVGAQGARYPGAVFPVTVDLRLRRNPELVDPEFAPGPGEPPSAVQEASTRVPPLAAGAPGDPLTLREFATRFQQALPGVRVATGRAEGASEADVWAVHFGEGGISRVEVAPGVAAGGTRIPRFFALRPLERQLVSREDVHVVDVNDDGTLDQGHALSLQGIDLEVWARDFLTGVDLFLSGPYATPVPGLNGGAQRGALDRVVAAKQALAAAIARGMDRVLATGDVPANGDDPARDAAVEALRQKLGIDLTDAYATDVLVQYDANVTSPFGAGAPGAALSGQGSALPLADASTPPVSVSVARTPLRDGGGYVNFLLTVHDDERVGSFPLRLGYAVNELEHGVVPVGDGYRASRWLSFVLPFGGDGAAPLPPGVRFGFDRVQVPLPLRTYPESPVLRAQEAAPGAEAPASIAEMERWDFAFAYTLREARQDRVRFRVDVNEREDEHGNRAHPLADEGLHPRGEEKLTLVEALAQYTHAAQSLQTILGRLPGTPAGTQDAVLGNAVESFATLVERVAGAWGRHWAPAGHVRTLRLPGGLHPAPHRRFAYTAELLADDAGAAYRTLALAVDPDASDSGPAWPGSGAPSVRCTLADGTAFDLAADAGGENRQTYRFPAEPAVPPYTRLTLAYRFSGLNVVRQQNARAWIGITRNEGLHPVARVADAFVYRTPDAGFADISTPLLVWERPLEAAPAGQALEPALRKILGEVLGDAPAGQQVAVAAQYGFALVDDPDDPAAALVTLLPVKLLPRFTWRDTAPAELAAALEAWRADARPTTDGGRWVFSVGVHSAVEGDLPRPLLELRHLFQRLQAPG
ncbi:MAG TPA: LysM domain-containing protein [Longimicrobium sp.]|nr:LysM domain-containing protein [Longimicrobium sp.]